jgi:surfactin synthase thioesterase subunit
MKELIGAVYNQIREEIDESPYALFGHSLGGLVSYEFVRLLSGYDKRMPLHVFISGATPPHIKYGDETLHTLPDYEFVREIVKLGGMSEEVINNRELMTLYTPIIRADYKIYETYVCGDNSPLDTDMTVFAGDDDQLLMRADPAQWKRYTTKNFKLKLYKGGHFFIHRYCPDVMAAIYTELVGGIPSDDMALMGAGGAVTYHD